MERSHSLSNEEAHHRNKNRKFLWIVLILIGVIILLASLFIITVIYRTRKSGRLRWNRNSTCSTECEFGAICNEENACECVFNCTDETHGNGYFNQCQLDQAKCESFYERNLTCSALNCSHGAKCALNDHGIPRCVCPENCEEYPRTTSSNGSVCASDHRTYPTICELNKKACERQEVLQLVHSGQCQHCANSSCVLNNRTCDPYVNCSFEYQPLCASNLHNYSNECQMQKYACQSNINLTKLHDGTCSPEEQQRLRQACKTFICLNGKSCMMENGVQVCRCLFNCSSEKNQVCAANGVLYRNLCELERDQCIRGENFKPVDDSFCCETIQCPYGRCKQQSNGKIQCECQSCSTKSSQQESICGDNGITYSSKCLLELDACTRQIDIKPTHLDSCNSCQKIVCPFYGQCRSENGNYTCICPTRESCFNSRMDNSSTICGSNQEFFYSQCEMNVRSCELKTHLYAIAPHYCTNTTDQTEYNQECGYDEPLLDLNLNRSMECDTIERCPLNSYCHQQTHRCCVKVMTAVLPYRMCREDRHCGRNMMCIDGFCQCAREDFIPARNKRECISILPHISNHSTCHTSPFGCCRDNQTISPTFDQRGCPEYCHCHPTGSLRRSCDPKSNSCYCRPAVGGLSCSHCENEYWAFSRILTHNNTGCTPCGCHPFGSTRRDCLQDTGQCLCHSYTIGRQCDKCLDSSLVLTDQGCVNLNKSRRRRQRTCQDLRCLFHGICEIIHGQPRCVCHQIICIQEEQHSMHICASDGRTYKSQCEIRQQQCLKQYEIVPMYPGVCHGIDEDFPIEDPYNSENELQTTPIDSKRCVIDIDCGENMVCLSEFCECAKQKYQRISGPRCIMPHSESFQSHPTGVFNPVRHISSDLCSQENLCENHARCQEHPDGSYQCLCAFGWRGRYCNEKIEITIPHFNGQSYLMFNSSDVIKDIDLIFTTERRHGLILYTENKFAEFDLMILIRNRTLELNIRLDHSKFTIPLSGSIDLHTFIRLQMHILYNEIQIKINDEIIRSKFLPLEISLKNHLYLGGLPDRLNSSQVDEGFQGCIHQLFLNGRKILFHNHSQITAQNLDECRTNLCQTEFCANEVRSSLIDRCLTKPCRINQQCVHIHPNNYLCICLNCSLNHRYTAGFHSNSYIKHWPLQPVEHTGRFHMEIWFLSEHSSGMLIYSEHINAKKGHMKLFIQRRIIIFNLIIGSRIISLSARYPIELNRWHRCSIEIYGQKLTLIVDRESPVIVYEFFSSTILWPRSFTFIGHLPSQYHSYIIEGFRGGIQKIILNNKQSWNDIRLNSIELFNISEYHGYPCQPNPCPSNLLCSQTELNNYTCQGVLQRNETSLALDGTINAIYSYKPMNLNRNYFHLAVKTKYSLGLIFYVGETSAAYFSSYLSLILVDGFVQFSVKIQPNASVVVLKSKIRIDDGRWHRIEIERYRRRIIMKLDDHYRYQTVLSNLETEFHPYPSYIYLGGYHRLCGYDDQHCRSYRGCLKDMTIDNHSLHLINDEINHHRLLKPCHDLI